MYCKRWYLSQSGDNAYLLHPIDFIIILYIYRFLYAVLLSLFFAVPSKEHLLDSGLGCQSSQEAKNCCRWCCRDFGSKSLPGVYSSASSSSMTYHTDLLKIWWESSWKATQNLLMGRSWTQCQQWSRLRSFPQRRAFSHEPIADLARMRTLVNVTFEQHSLGKHC